MTKVQRMTAVGAVLMLMLSTFGLMIGGIGPAAALSMLLIVIVVVTVVVPAMWRVVLHGVIAGAIAGLLVLGPALRGAMRLVAIVDPRATEFTLEGTFFIIIMVGGLFGIMLGVPGAVLRWTTSAAIALTAMTAAFIGMIVIDPNLRSELMELGSGPMMNIPLFTMAAGLYGLVTLRFLARFESRAARRRSTGRRGTKIMIPKAETSQVRRSRP